MKNCKILYIVLLLLAVSVIPALAENKEEGVIEGTVTDKSTGELLEGANVVLKGTKIGAATDKYGKFVITNIPHGDYILEVSFIGYETYKQHVHIDDEQKAILKIFLKETVLLMNEVVVTATRTRKTSENVPIRTEVIPELVIERSQERSVLELLGKQPGIKLQIDCSACNTAGLEINGLPTPYTKIMIDGMPVSGGLGSIYGLNNISTSSLKQVEIVKGASSSLYGTDAIAGTINLLTKDPSDYPELKVDIQGTNKKSHDMSINTTRKIEKLGIAVTGYKSHQDKLDNNGDDFSEYTGYDRFGGNAKLTYEYSENTNSFFSGSVLYEDRLGGSTIATRRDIGASDDFSMYLESVLTKRQEIRGGTSHIFEGNREISIKGQYTNHDQDSWYGTRGYLANQKNYYAEATLDGSMNKYIYLFGATIQKDKYWHDLSVRDGEDNHKMNYSHNYTIPGVMFQLSRMLKKYSTELVVSGRYDHHSEHGNIWTPKIAFKLNPVDKLSWRLAYGTGFRVSNPVTEEHSGLSGLVHFEPNTNLEPEKSKNINTSLTLNLPGAKNAFKLEAGIHYTTLNNFIVQTFSIKNNITYASSENLDGMAWTRGIDLNLQYISTNGIDMTLAYGFLDSEINRNGDIHELFWVPKHKITFDGLYTLSGSGLSFSLKGQYNGSQLYNHIDFQDRISKGSRTPGYFMFDTKVELPVKNQFTLYAGINNILDFKQVDENGNSPVTNEKGEFNPGGFIWGPLQGRKIFTGIRVNY